MLIHHWNTAFPSECVAEATGAIHPATSIDPVTDPITTVDLDNAEEKDSLNETQSEGEEHGPISGRRKNSVILAPRYYLTSKE